MSRTLSLVPSPDPGPGPGPNPNPNPNPEQASVDEQAALQAASGKPVVPKKSLTSYQLWMAEERPKLKASAATAAMGPKEAMAELGR